MNWRHTRLGRSLTSPDASPHSTATTAESRIVGFTDLERVLVPRSAVEVANSHMRSVGRDGYEGFALWIGRRDGTVFNVTETLIPAQSGVRSEDGVCVTVNGDELFRINVYLYDHGLTLIAQLHSHPTDAYHSDTDDSFPIATTVGAFSLVIPDFARHPFSFERCATYRLDHRSSWVSIPPDAVGRIFKFTDGLEG